MNIAVQLYTLRDFLKTPEQIADSFQRIRAIGYEAVQVAGMGNACKPEQLKQLADEAGLTICSAYVPFEALIGDIDSVIQKLQLWQCTNVGVGSFPASFPRTAEGFIEYAGVASRIGHRLHDAGFRFMYHNHNYEFAKFDGKTGLDLLNEHSDPRYLYFELDVYWAQAGGADPIQQLLRLNHRVKTIHLKDMTIVGREQRYAELGEGNMNIPAILELCGKLGIEWGIVEQDLCYERNPFDSIAISRDYLRKQEAAFTV